ncbi:hypothetical protein LINPERPRIM_LOCUS13081, partial [Linum perenne]
FPSTFSIGYHFECDPSKLFPFREFRITRLLKYDSCSITRAEIKVALVGLELVSNAGYRRVCLQLDSMTAYLILTNVGDLSHQHAREVLRFRELLSRHWVVTLKHIFREGNQATDYLAAIEHGRDSRLHLISSSDPDLSAIILYDSLHA